MRSGLNGMTIMTQEYIHSNSYENYVCVKNASLLTISAILKLKLLMIYCISKTMFTVALTVSSPSSIGVGAASGAAANFATPNSLNTGLGTS